jgi:hypothetical protein
MEQDLTSVLLQQLEYIASVRTQLPSETTAACKQRFKLISSSGNVQETASLYLPPSNQAAKELLLELAQTGQGLQLLAPAFQQLWEDEDKRLVLTSVLGLKEAGATAVVGALADFHSGSSSSGSSIDEEQLMRHLKYLAAHTDILEDASNAMVLKRFKESIQLLDAHGLYSSTSSLFFPLDQQSHYLEQELGSAGMRFLSSSMAAAAVCTDEASLPSHRHMKELLLLLGVREPKISTVAEFILQLYETPEAVAALTMEHHMLHVKFFCENLVGLKGLNLQSKFQIYSEMQDLKCEGPAFEPAGLCWPLSPFMNEGIKQHLRQCGVVFVASEYTECCCTTLEVNEAVVKDFLVEVAGVRELGPEEVGAAAGKLWAGYKVAATCCVWCPDVTHCRNEVAILPSLPAAGPVQAHHGHMFLSPERTHRSHYSELFSSAALHYAYYA